MIMVLGDEEGIVYSMASHPPCITNACIYLICELSSQIPIANQISVIEFDFSIIIVKKFSKWYILKCNDIWLW